MSFPLAVAVPNVVTNLSTVVTAREVVVSWTVSNISYSTERYRVEHRLAGDNQILQCSQTIESGILDSNTHHSVRLRNLTHNSTYIYNIVAENCIGNSTTELNQFMTLQDGNALVVLSVDFSIFQFSHSTKC